MPHCTVCLRHDSATKELAGHHKQCDLLCSVTSGGMIRREKLEEMYMFLKSNVLAGESILLGAHIIYKHISVFLSLGTLVRE